MKTEIFSKKFKNGHNLELIKSVDFNHITLPIHTRSLKNSTHSGDFKRNRKKE